MSSNEFGEDGSKFDYFIPIFEKCLEKNSDSIDAIVGHDMLKEYEVEYTQVLEGYKSIHTQFAENVIKHPDVGLVCIQNIAPLHYYSLFSATIGYDIVCAMYNDGKYEVELKYTTFIDLASRASLPRIDMTNLARTLNALEKYEEEAKKPTSTPLKMSGDAWDEDNGSPSTSTLSQESNEISPRRVLLKQKMEAQKARIKANKLNKQNSITNNTELKPLVLAVDEDYKAVDEGDSNANPIIWVSNSITDSGPILRRDHVK